MSGAGSGANTRRAAVVERWPRWAGWLLLSAFPIVWNERVTGTLSVAVVVWSVAMVAVCGVYGRAILRVARRTLSPRGAAVEMLIGFFCVNTLLFVSMVATPFGAVGNCGVLAVGALLLLPYVLRADAGLDGDPGSERASLACIAVCGIAATLWTRDFQPLTRADGDGTVFKAWADIFVHAREISMFAGSHGLSTFSDIKASGHPAPLYHVASYMASAAMSKLTQTSALDTFASLQLPLAILLGGLAAFALGTALFGAWPGAVAAIAVVTLPDPYQQGLGIRLLAYHFMSQVNVGTLYGIACAGLAWLFVIEGCRTRRWPAIVCGYVLLLVALTYKAHIFVANAYPLLVFPCFFFPGVRVRWRLAVAVCFTVVFVAAIVVGQSSPRVPVMRLDGSGLSPYITLLLDAADPGRLKNWFDATLRVGRPPKIVAGVWEVLLIGLATFGVWLAVFPIAWWRGRRRWTNATLWFPLVVVVNYFVMTLGLALDSRRIGGPEELLNRPAAWAYFVVVVCSVGAIGAIVASLRTERSGSSVAVRSSVTVAVIAALAGVFILGRNLQTYPAWDGYADYVVFNRWPRCFVEAGEYVRRHAAPDDLIQDGKADPSFVLTAVSERQAFVIASGFGGGGSDQASRLAAVAALATEGDTGRIVDDLRRRGIAWYLTQRSSIPGDDRHVAFACEDYRLLHADRTGAVEAGPP